MQDQLLQQPLACFTMHTLDFMHTLGARHPTTSSALSHSRQQVSADWEHMCKFRLQQPAQGDTGVHRQLVQGKWELGGLKVKPSCSLAVERLEGGNQLLCPFCGRSIADNRATAARHLAVDSHSVFGAATCRHISERSMAASSSSCTPRRPAVNAGLAETSTESAAVLQLVALTCRLNR